jgi:Putative transposase
LWQKEWVVYAKQPFAGPQQIIQYLSNYTHRIAISNHRLISCEDGKVSFRWRDYADRSKTKVMTLSADEFIRRYLQHVLPLGFTRIRQIGFLANRYKAEKLKKCRTALDFHAEPIIEEAVDKLLLRVYHININLCRHCYIGSKQPISILVDKYHSGPDTS